MTIFENTNKADNITLDILEFGIRHIIVKEVIIDYFKKYKI